MAVLAVSAVMAVSVMTAPPLKLNPPFSQILISGARRPPQLLEKRSENARANENLSCGFPSIPGIAPRVAPRILVLALLKS